MLFCNGEVRMYWWGQRPVHLKAKLNKIFLIKVLWLGGGGQLAQILGRYVPWQNQKVDL